MELKKIEGGRVYLDANIFIYAIEGNDEYKKQINALFSRISEVGALAVTSEFTLAECLVKPYSENDNNSVLKYEEHIKNSDLLKVKSLPLNLLKKSAQMRAELKNKLPDSIYIATALNEACDFFITNDIKLKTPSTLKKIILRDI